MTVFGEVGTGEPPTDALEFVRKKMAERRSAEAQRVTLRDRLSRPDLVLTCRIPTRLEETKDIPNQAEQAAKKGAPFGVALACMMLARFTEQVTLDGRDLAPGDGAAFAWPPLQEAVEAPTAWQAVRALVDDDFAVDRLFSRFQKAAGIGDDDAVEQETPDPTTGP